MPDTLQIQTRMFPNYLKGKEPTIEHIVTTPTETHRIQFPAKQVHKDPIIYAEHLIEWAYNLQPHRKEVK